MPKKIKARKCPICSEVFTPKRDKGIYDCEPCRKVAYQIRVREKIRKEILDELKVKIG